MSSEHLTLDIFYDFNKDEFRVEGNVNEEGRIELIDTFLRRQNSSKKSNREYIERDEYHIRIEWYPENDRIKVSSDTGNEGLRDGILRNYLKEAVSSS